MKQKKKELLASIESDKKKPNQTRIDSNKSRKKSFWKGLGRFEKVGIIGLCLLLVGGVLGSGLADSVINTFTGDSKNSSNSKNGSNSNNSEGSLLSKLNPFAEAEPPNPTNTPQLSKSYIYAGSRMLAVEDAGATSSTPADLAVWRPDTGNNTGTWWVMDADGPKHLDFQWGLATDIPTPGDFDGDGKTDFCIYRSSNNQWWIVKSSDDTSYAMTFGISGDKPAQADFDGDGMTDVAVFRPSNGTWYIYRSSDGGVTSQQFGVSSDIPTPVDFDGDGKADIAFYRSSEAKYYYQYSSQTNGSFNVIAFGQAGDKPVPGDYDGDGKADAAVWRSDYTWHILNSSSQTVEGYTFGDPNSDVYVQNDYDGDGRVDRAFWRPSNGNWYIVNSSDNSVRTVQWGQNGDTPVPAYYRR